MNARYDYSSNSSRKPKEYDLGGRMSYDTYSNKKVRKYSSKPGDNTLRQEYNGQLEERAVLETYKYYSQQNDHNDALSLTAKDHQMDIDLVEEIVEHRTIMDGTDDGEIEKMYEAASLVTEDEDSSKYFVTGIHKIKNGMDSLLTVQEAKVLTKCFVSMLTLNEGLEIFAALRSTFENLNEQKMIQIYNDFLNDDFVIDTRKYIKENGKQPQGFKTWTFKIADDIFWFQGNYTEAKNKAIREASVLGVDKVYLIK